MQSSTSKWLSVVCLFVGMGLIALPAVGQKQSSPNQLAIPVNVVNSPSTPVPVAPQGTTNVAGTVNVGNTPNVNVTNTPSVSVANTPSVTLAGTPTVALSPGGITGVTNPLDNQSNATPLAVLDAIQPYEDGCTIVVSSGVSATCNFQQIPANKRLVIEEFDAEGFMDTGAKPVDVGLSATPALGHHFPATFMGTQGASDYFATHQTTRLYSPPNFPPQCEVTLSVSVNSALYFCRLSGFLVDVP